MFYLIYNVVAITHVNIVYIYSQTPHQSAAPINAQPEVSVWMM